MIRRAKRIAVGLGVLLLSVDCYNATRAEQSRHGMLGVDVYAHTIDIQGGYGVKVANVVPGSGAEAAGIQEGDVIFEIDGKRMSSGTDLFCHIQSRGPGARVALRLKGRNAGEGDLRLTAIVGTWPPGTPPPLADCAAQY